MGVIMNKIDKMIVNTILQTIFVILMCIFSFIYVFNTSGTERIIMIIVGVISIIMSLIYFLMAGKRKVNVQNNVDIEK